MGNLIVVIVLMLGVVAIAQLMRVYELSAKLRGKKEEEISNSDNVMNARLMLTFMVAFYIYFFYLLAEYGDGGIGLSASEHGRDLDWMMQFNWALLFVMFFVTTTMLFWFSYRYYHKGPGTRAHWFPHNNRLELLWTTVPAAVLAIIITYGLIMWNDIMYNDDKGKVIELYAKQFDWTARYAGKDNKLGAANFRMINAEYNPLGIVTNESSERRIEEIRAEVIGCAITYYRDTRDASIVKELQHKAMVGKTDFIQQLKDKIAELEKMPYDQATVHVSDKKLAEAREKLDRLQRHILKLQSLAAITIADKKLEAAADDDIIAKELHMVKGETYHFQFRSQDVIHSAYLPHFRAQMNCVPGMVTSFSFKPIMTTQEMRDHKNNQKFDYVLLCNKICGATHYNMKMHVVVHETEKEMEEWLKTQDSFAKKMGLEEKPAETPANTPSADSTAKADSTGN